MGNKPSNNAADAAPPVPPAIGVPPPAQSPQKKKRRQGTVTGKYRDITKRYDVEPLELGHGHYGKVRVGVHRRTGKRCAIKTIPKSKVAKLDVLRNEIEIMQSLDHPNIIKLEDTFEDPRYIHLVMELCGGGELFNRIIQKGHYTEAETAEALTMILEALAHCHQHNICHRDLKPENFLYESIAADSPLKVIDFGLSRIYAEGEAMHTRVGTPYYIAPEVLSRDYGVKCDLWSVGVIMYILMCGYPPFWGDTDAEIFGRVRAGVFDFDGEEWTGVSDSAKDLISSLLRLDVAARPTAAEALQHVWFEEAASYMPEFEMEDCLADMSAPPPQATATATATATDAAADAPAAAADAESKAAPPAAGAAAADKAAPRLHPAVVSRLKAFAGLSKMKRMALRVIAEELTGQQIQGLHAQFAAMDTDGNGVVTADELAVACGEVGSEAATARVTELMRSLDVDGNGKIEYAEFLAATMKKRLYEHEDRLYAAFKHFDNDDNGSITLEELSQALGDGVMAQEMLKTVDANADGSIDFGEFRRMMLTEDDAQLHSAALLLLSRSISMDLEGEDGDGDDAAEAAAPAAGEEGKAAEAEAGAEAEATAATGGDAATEGDAQPQAAEAEAEAEEAEEANA